MIHFYILEGTASLQDRPATEGGAEEQGKDILIQAIAYFSL